MGKNDAFGRVSEIVDSVLLVIRYIFMLVRLILYLVKYARLHRQLNSFEAEVDFSRLADKPRPPAAAGADASRT